jgi:AcrR family transcriptional regulator
MPRPDVSDERRPQIINAALRVFSRKGYHGATMPEIAAEAGLSVGGLYWYYKSKDAVVAAILAQLFEADLDALAILLAEERPAAERLLAFAQHAVATFDEHRWLIPVGIDLYGAAAHDEQARGFIQRYLGRYREALATLITQGVARGEFHPVESHDAANALLALEEGLSLLWAADPDNVRYREGFAVGVQLFVDGLRRS